ncbi:MAG: dienelactone hydrolase family protein [Myxococcales bacterium]|nr:dienelactone hydrolase family protein [Myxococcales bacterium]
MRGLATAIAACLLVATNAARADDPPTSAAPKRWCAPELESLPGDVCYHGEPAHEGRRTLVIFLHGLVEDGTDWQYHQQRGIVRGAARLGYSVLAPRGRVGASRTGGDSRVAWPTAMTARQAHEDAVLAEWQRARELVEQREGAPFDEVFVLGFSNGAYYASSLALRGRLAVDGYAVFAGGTAYAPSAGGAARAPVFVAIAGQDKTTFDDARSLARALEAAGWPHRAETRKVGHAIADAHLDHALDYLRARAREAGKGGH